MSHIDSLDLTALNTFGVHSIAEKWSEIRNIGDLQNLGSIENPDFLVLGGGSNVLFTSPKVDRHILLNKLYGKEIIEENEETVRIKIQSGEIWDDLVQYTVQHNWGGLENLSLIPGTVGAAPMQNIGAYGVEVKDHIVSVEFWDFSSQKINTISSNDCDFDYRSSIFKKELKDKVFITAVEFSLTKKNHQLNTSYGALDAELKNRNIAQPTISDIADTVVSIRRSKLPDPKLLGNAGSFFKNPVVGREQFGALSGEMDVPHYEVSEDMVKIPAAWLIEQCGWKGYRDGDVGVSPKQALVLINYGNATGEDIYSLSQKIIDSVFLKFAIALEREVNII